MTNLEGEFLELPELDLERLQTVWQEAVFAPIEPPQSDVIEKILRRHRRQRWSAGCGVPPLPSPPCFTRSSRLASRRWSGIKLPITYHFIGSVMNTGRPVEAILSRAFVAWVPADK